MINLESNSQPTVNLHQMQLLQGNLKYQRQRARASLATCISTFSDSLDTSLQDSEQQKLNQTQEVKQKKTLLKGIKIKQMDDETQQKEWKDVFENQDGLTKVDLEEFIVKDPEIYLLDKNELKQKQLKENLQKLQQHEDSQPIFINYFIKDIKHLSTYTTEKISQIGKIYEKLKQEQQNNTNLEELKQKFDKLNNKISKINLYQNKTQFFQYFDSQEYMKNNLFNTISCHQYDPLIFFNKFDEIQYASYSFNKFVEKQEESLRTFVKIQNDCFSSFKVFNGVLNNVLCAGDFHSKNLRLYDIEQQKLLKLYQLNQQQQQCIPTFLSNKEFELIIGLFNGNLLFFDYRQKLQQNIVNVCQNQPILDLIQLEDYILVLSSEKIIRIDLRNQMKPLWELSVPQPKRKLFLQGDSISIDMQTYYNIQTGRAHYLNQFTKTPILSQLTSTEFLTAQGLFSQHSLKSKKFKQILNFDNFLIQEGEILLGREEFCVLLGRDNDGKGCVRSVEWQIEKNKQEKVKEALIERLALGFDNNSIALF